MNWWGDDNCKYCGYKKWSERCEAMSKQGMQCEDTKYHSGKHYYHGIRRFFD